MEVRILRGAHEVGGSCVELRHDGATLLLDLGRPLTAGRDDVVPLPPAVGLASPGELPLGVVVSHGHADHWGLVPQLPPEVPVWWSAGTAAVLTAASFWGSGHDCTGDRVYRTDEPFEVGPFTVTPHLADHSAYDAHSLLVEAGGRRLFYTGDVRAHGRKPGAFERVLDGSVGRVDAMLMEGTSLRDDDEGGVPPTEGEVEEQLVAELSSRSGLVTVLSSTQNIDRLVTVYRAARRAGRKVALDLASAEVVLATERPSLPQPGVEWPHVAVYLTADQRRRVMAVGAYCRTDAVKEVRVYDEQLRADPGGWVLCGAFQRSLPALLQRGVLEGGAVVWSMWSGYLDEPRQQKIAATVSVAGVPLVQHHTSGHASVADLRRLVGAVRPTALVPIHTDAPERYAEVFGPSAVTRADGEWWDV